MNNFNATIAINKVTSQNFIGTIGLIAACHFAKQFDARIDQTATMVESILNCDYTGSNSGAMSERVNHFKMPGYKLCWFEPKLSLRHLNSLTDTLMALCGKNVRPSLGENLQQLVKV